MNQEISFRSLLQILNQNGYSTRRMAGKNITYRIGNIAHISEWDYGRKCYDLDKRKPPSGARSRSVGKSESRSVTANKGSRKLRKATAKSNRNPDRKK